MPSHTVSLDNQIATHLLHNSFHTVSDFNQCHVIVIKASFVLYLIEGVLAIAKPALGYPCWHMEGQGGLQNRALLPEMNNFIYAGTLWTTKVVLTTYCLILAKELKSCRWVLVEFISIFQISYDISVCISTS